MWLVTLLTVVASQYHRSQAECYRSTVQTFAQVYDANELPSGVFRKAINEISSAAADRSGSIYFNPFTNREDDFPSIKFILRTMLVGIPGERTAILKQLSSDTMSGERTVVDYLGQYSEGFSVRYRVLKEGYFDKAVALCKEVFLRMDRMRRLLNQSGVSSNKKKLKRHSGSFDFERDNPLRKYRHFPMSEISRNSFIGNGHQCWRFPWKNAHHRAPRRNNREVVEVEIEIEFTQPKSQQFPAGRRSLDDYMRRRAANIDTEKDRLENEHNQYNTSIPLPNTDSKTVNLNSITLSPTENYQKTGQDIKADSKTITQSPQRNEAEGQVAPYRTISPTLKLSRRNVKIAATPDTPSENYRSIGGGIRQGKAQIITKNPESSEGAPGENAEEDDADDNTVTPSTSNLSRRTANITASPNITRENYQSIGQEFRKANTENIRGSPGSNEEDPRGNKEEDDTNVNTITNPTSKLSRRTGNVDSSRGTPDEDNQDTTQGTRKPNTESIAASQESVIDRSQLNDEEGGVFQDISSSNMLNRRTSTAEIFSGDKQGVGRGIRKPSAVTENAGYNEEERDITDNIIAPHMHSLNRRTAKMIGQGVRKPKAQSITEGPGEIGEEDFIDSIITPITLKPSRWTANITPTSESLSEDNQGIEEETRTLNEKYTSENPEGKGENSDRNGEGDITGNVIGNGNVTVTHSPNRRTGKVSSTSETPAVANQGTEEGTRKPNTENATETPETDRSSANDEESKVDNTDSSTASKASRRSSKVPYVPQTPAEGDKLIKEGTGKPNAEKITENLGAASENPGESDEEGDIKDNIIAPNMHNLNRRNGEVSSSPETPTERNQGREEVTRKTNTESTTKNPETASEEGDIKDNVIAPYMHNLNRRTAKVSSTPETPSEGNQGREDGTGKQNPKETTENLEAASEDPGESDEERDIKDNIIAPYMHNLNRRTGKVSSTPETPSEGNQGREERTRNTKAANTTDSSETTSENPSQSGEEGGIKDSIIAPYMHNFNRRTGKVSFTSETPSEGNQGTEERTRKTNAANTTDSSETTSENPSQSGEEGGIKDNIIAPYMHDLNRRTGKVSSTPETPSEGNQGREDETGKQNAKETTKNSEAASEDPGESDEERDIKDNIIAPYMHNLNRRTGKVSSTPETPSEGNQGREERTRNTKAANTTDSSETTSENPSQSGEEGGIKDSIIAPYMHNFNRRTGKVSFTSETPSEGNHGTEERTRKTNAANTTDSSETTSENPSQSGEEGGIKDSIIAPYMHNFNRRTGKVSFTSETPSEGNQGTEKRTRKTNAANTTDSSETTSENPSQSGEEGGIKDNIIAPYMHDLNRRTGKVSSTSETPSEGNQGREGGTRKQNTEDTTENPEATRRYPGESGEIGAIKDNVIAPYMHNLNRRTGKVSFTSETPSEGNQGTEERTRKTKAANTTDSSETTSENPSQSGEEGGIKDSIIAPYMHNLNRRTGKVSSTPETPSEGNQGREEGTRKQNTEDTTENPEAASENPSESGEEGGIKNNVIAPYMHNLNRRTGKVSFTPETPPEGNQGREEGTRKQSAENNTENPEAASRYPGESGEKGAIKDNVIAPYMHNLNRRTGKVSSTSETPSEGNQGTEERTRKTKAANTTDSSETTSENPSQSGEEGDIKNNVIAPYMHNLNRRTGKVSFTPETPPEGNQGREEGTRKQSAENNTENPEAASRYPGESGEKGAIKDNVIAPYMHNLNRRTGKVSFTPETPSEGNQGTEGTRKTNAANTADSSETTSENPSQSGGEEGDIKDNIIAPYMHNLNRRTGKVSSTPETPSEGNQGREEGTRKQNTEDTTENPEAASENPSESGEEGGIKNNVIAPYMHNLNRRTGKVSFTPETPPEGNQGREEGTRKQSAENNTENPEAASRYPGESGEKGAIKDNVIAPYMHNLNRRTGKVSFTPETPSEGNQGTEGTRKMNAANTADSSETKSENPSQSGGEEGDIKDNIIAPYMHNLNRRTAKVSSTPENPPEGNQGREEGTRKQNAEDTTENPGAARENPSESGEEGDIKENIIAPYMHNLNRRTGKVSFTPETPFEGNQGREEETGKQNAEDTTDSSETTSEDPSQSGEEGKIKDSVIAPYMHSLNRRTGKNSSTPETPSEGNQGREDGTRNPNTEDTTEDPEAASENPSESGEEGDIKNNVIAPYMHNLNRRTGKVSFTPEPPSEGNRGREEGTRKPNTESTTKNPETASENPSESGEEGGIKDNVIAPYMHSLNRRTGKNSSTPETPSEGNQGREDGTRNPNTEDTTEDPEAASENPSESGEEGDIKNNVIAPYMHSLNRRTGKNSSTPETPSEGNQGREDGTRNPNTEDTTEDPEAAGENPSESGEEGGIKDNVIAPHMHSLNRRTGKVSSTRETPSEGNQGKEEGARKSNPEGTTKNPNAASENPSEIGEAGGIKDNVIAPHMHSLNRRTGKISSTPDTPSEGNQGREEGTRKQNTEDTTEDPEAASENPGEIGEAGGIKDNVIAPHMHSLNRRTGKISSTRETPSEGNQGKEEGARKSNPEGTTKNPNAASENPGESGEEGDTKDNVIASYMRSLNRRTAEVTSTLETPFEGNQGGEGGTGKQNTEDITENPEAATENPGESGEEGDIKENIIAPYMHNLNRRTGKVSFTPETSFEGNQGREAGTRKQSAENTAENPEAATENPGESGEEGAIKNNIIAPYMHNLNRRTGKVSFTPETPSEGSQGREEGTRNPNTEDTTEDPEAASENPSESGEEGAIKNNVIAPYMHNLNRRTGKVSFTPETESEGNQATVERTRKTNAANTTDSSEATSENPSENDEEGAIKNSVISPYMHNLNRRTGKVSFTPETPSEGNQGREEGTRKQNADYTTENPETASQNPSESGEEGDIKDNIIAPYMHGLSRRTGKVSFTPEASSEGNQGREEGARKSNTESTTKNSEAAIENPGEIGEAGDIKDNVIAHHMHSLNRRTGKISSTPDTPSEGNQGREEGTRKQNTEDTTEDPEAASENPSESGEEGGIKNNVIAPYMHNLNRRTAKVASTPETPFEGNHGREEETRNPITEDTTENPEAASENPGESGEEGGIKNNVIAHHMHSLNRRTGKISSTPDTPSEGNQGREEGTRKQNTEDTTEDPEAASENPSESGEEGGIKNNVIAPYMHNLNRRTAKVASTPETPFEGNHGREEETRNPITEDTTENPEAASENPGESGEEGGIKNNVIAPYMHSLNRRTGKISSTPETPSEGNQGREEGTRKQNADYTTENPETASQNPSESGEESDTKDNVIASYMRSLNRRTAKVTSTPETPFEGNQGGEDGTGKQNTEDKTENPEAATENPGESGEEGKIKDNVIAPYMHSLNRRTGKISSTPETPSEGNQGREDGTRNPNTEDTTENPEAASENPGESGEESDTKDNVIASYMRSLNRRTAKVTSTPETPFKGNQGGEDGTRNPNTEDTTEDPEAASENPSESGEEGGIKNNVIAPYMHSLNRRTGKISSTPETPSEGNQGREEGTRNPDTEDVTENPEAATENPGESGEEGKIKDNVIAPYMHSLNRRTGKISSTPETPSEGNQGREDGTRNPNTEDTTEDPEAASENPSESGEEGGIKNNVIAPYMHSLNRRTGKISSTPEFPSEGNQGREEGTRNPNTEDTTEDPEAASENPSESGEEGDIKNNVIAPYMNSLNRRTGKISSTPEFPSEGNQGREDGTRNPNTEDTTEDPEAAIENPSESDEEGAIMNSVIAPYMNSLNRRTGKISSTPEFPSEGNQGREDGTRNPNTEDTTEDPEAAIENPSESDEEGAIMNSVIAPYMHNLNRRTAKVSFTPETPSEGNQGTEGTRKTDAANTIENPETASENPSESGEEGAAAIGSSQRGEASNDGSERGERENVAVQDFMIRPTVAKFFRRKATINSTREVYNKGSQGIVQGVRKGHATEKTETLETSNEPAEEIDQERVVIVDNIIKPTVAKLFHRTITANSTSRSRPKGSEQAASNMSIGSSKSKMETRSQQNAEEEHRDEKRDAESITSANQMKLSRRTGEVASSSGADRRDFHAAQEAAKNLDILDLADNAGTNVEQFEKSEVEHEKTDAQGDASTDRANFFRRTAEATSSSGVNTKNFQVKEGATNNLSLLDVANKTRTNVEQMERSEVLHEKTDAVNVTSTNQANFFRKTAKIDSNSEAYKEDPHVAHQATKNLSTLDVANVTRTSAEQVERSEVGHEKTDTINVASTNQANLFRRTAKVSSFSEANKKDSHVAHQAIENLSTHDVANETRTNAERVESSEVGHEKTDAVNVASTNQANLFRRTAKVSSFSETASEDFQKTGELTGIAGISEFNAHKARTAIEHVDRSKYRHEETDVEDVTSTNQTKSIRGAGKVSSLLEASTEYSQGIENASDSASTHDDGFGLRLDLERHEGRKHRDGKIDSEMVRSRSQASLYHGSVKHESSSVVGTSDHQDVEKTTPKSSIDSIREISATEDSFEVIQGKGHGSNFNEIEDIVDDPTFEEIFLQRVSPSP